MNGYCLSDKNVSTIMKPDYANYTNKTNNASSVKFHIGKLYLTLFTLALPLYLEEDKSAIQDSSYDNLIANLADKRKGPTTHCSNLILPENYTLAFSSDNFTKLQASFIENCSDATVRVKLFPVFRFLSANLKELYFKNVFVDVIPEKAMIDINMNLGNKILLSVGKSLSDTVDDMVDFSISVDGNLYMVDEMSIGDLMCRMKSVQQEIRDNDKIA